MFMLRWTCAALVVTAVSTPVLTLADSQKWSGSAGDGQWLNTGNWTGTPIPGAPTVTTNSDNALFRSGTTTVGIDMGVAAGNYYLGSIVTIDGSGGPTITNSSITPGVLTLNGNSNPSDVDFSNVIIEKVANSNGTSLTIANGTGGNGSLGVNLPTAGPNDGSLNRIVIFNNSTSARTPGTVTIGSNISGAGPLTIGRGYDATKPISTTAAVFNLNGTNSYTGGTFVGGNLSGDPNGSTAITSTVNVSGDNSAANGGWQIEVDTQRTTYNVNFQTGSIVAVAAGKSVDLVATAGSGPHANLNVAGTVNSAGNLTVERAGVLTVQNSGVWNQSGNMAVTHAAGGGIGATLTVSGGGTFNYTGANPVAVNSQSIDGGTASMALNIQGLFATGQGFVNNAPLLTSSSSANVTISGGGTLQLTGNVPTLTSSPSGAPFNFTLSSGDGNIDTNSFSTTMSRVIDGSGNLNKQGDGSLALATANSYSGNTNIVNGDVTVTNSGALGSTTGAGGNGAQGYTAILQPANGHAAGSLSIGNSATASDVLYLDSHDTNGANTAHVYALSGSNSTVSGVVSTYLPGGTFTDDNWKYFTFQANSNSTLTLSGDIRQDVSNTAAVLTLRGAGNGLVSGNIIEPTTTYFDQTAVTGNTWSLVKNGGGAWVLTGNNTYSGTTEVASGALIVNGLNSGTGAVTVDSGAILGGSGTINGVVTVAGTIAPSAGGTPPSALFTVGGLTMQTGAQMTWHLAGLSTSGPGTNYDQIVVNGPLALGTGASLSIDLTTLAAGQQPGGGNPFWSSSHTWTIINPTSNPGNSNFASIVGGTVATGTFSLSVNAGAVVGDVNGDHVVNGLDIAVVASHWLLTGATLSQGDANGDGTVNGLDIASIASHWLSTGGGGNGSILLTYTPSAGSGTAVPEPSTYVLAAFGLVGIVTARRRRAC